MIPSAEAAVLIQEVLASRGFTLSGDSIRSPTGEVIKIPDIGSIDDLADMPSAVPSRARGDLREKILYNIVQDMGGIPPKRRLPDSRLRDALSSRVKADRTGQQVLSGVMARQYWVVPTRRAGALGSPFLTPFHTVLPSAYDYSGRYKSFRGSLLLFLSWTGSGFDLTAARKLATFLESSDGLTLLDQELLRVATELVAEEETTFPNSDAERLLTDFGSDMSARFVEGSFDLPGLERIRNDLITILDLPLPRHDKVAAVVQGLSVNLALYYYRLAFILGEGIAACVSAAAGVYPGDAPDFNGRLLFRVGSGGDRPVRLDEPCSQSFLELDNRHLLALPANMAVANILHEVGTELGIVSRPAVPDPHGLARAMHDISGAAENVDALSATLAICIAATDGGAVAATEQSLEPGTGCFAIREVVLDNFRARGNALKQRGRDVVHTLVGGYVGGLKRSRGRVNFFELDEPILFLLVKLILAGSAHNQMPFRTTFLSALAAYGLQPQDRIEEDELAGALERLGLLRRYSDAGEALYVSQPD